ncbi:hypothetical protein Cgig2_011874 [Carnegiea gigantea]|uniref:Uncharacterized protein n=1 Tax=Carnegiea gigantea TaxID=171969 RepID=A0A9Q1QEL0_9CARY|nr:hypothetical protein Cgig2_011874 [Carnegiea gigantea]
MKLMKLMQRYEELLDDHVEIFNLEILFAEGLKLGVALAFFTNGVRHAKLYEQFIMEPPASLAKALNTVQGYFEFLIIKRPSSASREASKRDEKRSRKESVAATGIHIEDLHDTLFALDAFNQMPSVIISEKAPKFLKFKPIAIVWPFLAIGSL